jgi:hypothetical protein
MGVLNQLRPATATVEMVTKPRQSALSLAIELSSKPKPTEPATHHQCQACGSVCWWIPIGSGKPLCLSCSPPSGLAMVAKQYFFDDWKNIWRVDRNKDGTDSYVRETFEEGSPDAIHETQIEALL